MSVRRRLAALLALALLVVACDAGTPTPSPADVSAPSDAIVPPSAASVAAPSVEPAGPTFAGVECPDDVTVVMVVVPTCGYLTVPERRDRPDGRTVRVFVVRIDPKGVTPPPDAMVVAGGTLGQRIEYGELAPLAARTGRVAYLVDRRGTGLSEPSLDCPEVVAAAPATLAHPYGSTAASEPILDAIRACRARLEGDGVDLSAYGLEASAQDIEDLRLALGADPWNVIGFGTSSRLALEVGRVAPEGVRTLALDSAVPPQGPDPLFNAAASRSSIDELAKRCRSVPACRKRYPDPAATLDLAARTLDRAPAAVTVDAPGGAVSVLVDGARFGRAVRSMLAEHGGQVVQMVLPSATAAIRGQLTANDPLVQRLVRDDGLCVGFVPQCEQTVHGSLLSTICPDVIPYVDSDAALAAGAGVPGMARAFAANPYFAACDAWGVPAGDPASAQPPRSTIPALAMTGQFDPFAGPIADVADGLSRLERLDAVEVPNQSYNVFGYDECPRDVRRAWLDEPGAPLDTGCFAGLQVVRPLVDVSP